MEASSQRTWQLRLALMLILGVGSVAACVAAFTLWKAPAASAQVAATSEAFAEPLFPEAVFVTRCNFSHRNMDDPIVFPGQPGAAHSHDFFANRSTKYNSTDESLQASGTTCVNPDDKSAYWIPTVSWTNNSGTRKLTASTAHFYYRAGGKPPEDVQPPPPGLKVVPNTHVKWRCAENTAVSPSPPTRCSSGTLVVAIRFPDCSDGRIDSADHRSHMAYAVDQPDGPNLCPDTHAIPVATLTMEVKFKIGTSSGTVKLSSDPQGAPPGSTMHADFFNAWDQEKLTALVESCINAYPFTENPKPANCRQV